MTDVESAVVTQDDVESIGSADESGEWVDHDEDGEWEDDGDEEWDDDNEEDVVEEDHGSKELKVEDDHTTLDHTSSESPTQSLASTSSTSSHNNNNNDDTNNAAPNDATPTTIVAASTFKTKRKNPLDGSFHEKEFLCTISSSSDASNPPNTSDSNDPELQVNIVDKEHKKSVLNASITDIFKDAGDLLLDLNHFLSELDNDKKTTTTETIPEECDDYSTTDPQESEILVNQPGVQIQRGNSSSQLLLSANTRRLSTGGQNGDKTTATTTDAIIRGSNKEQKAAAVMTMLTNPKVLKSLHVLDETNTTASNTSPPSDEQDTDFWLEVEQLESVEGDLADELSRISILDAESAILENDIPDDDDDLELETDDILDDDDDDHPELGTPSTGGDDILDDDDDHLNPPSTMNDDILGDDDDDDDHPELNTPSTMDDAAADEQTPSNENVDNADLQDIAQEDDHMDDKEAEKEESPLIEEETSPRSIMNEQESNTRQLPMEEPNESESNEDAALEEPKGGDKDKTTTDIQANTDTDRKPQTKHKEMMKMMMEAIEDDDDLKMLDDDLKMLNDDLDGMRKEDADVAAVVIIPREEEPEEEEEWEDDAEDDEDDEWDEDGEEDAEWEEDGPKEKEVPYKPVAMPVQHSASFQEEKEEEVKPEEKEDLQEEEEWEDDDEDLERGNFQPTTLEDDVENQVSKSPSLQGEEASACEKKREKYSWTQQRYNRYRGCGLIILGIVVIGVGLLTQL